MLWIAIFFRWRDGIWFFIVLSSMLMGYAFSRVLKMVQDDAVLTSPLECAYYSMQIFFELMCILVAIWVLNTPQGGKEKNDEEKPLL